MSAGLCLLGLLYILFLLPLIFLRNTIEQQYLLVGMEIWAIICALAFIPSLALIIKKSWLFTGTEEPVVHSLLLSLLQEVNIFNTPVVVRKKRKKLVVTWRINEPDWADKMESKDLKKLYELHLSFNNSTKTVSMSDRFRSVQWDYLSKKCKTGWIAFPKPFFKVKTGKEWGIENYQHCAPDTYNFLPEEIKSPVLNTILRNGWNVRFSLF